MKAWATVHRTSKSAHTASHLCRHAMSAHPRSCLCHHPSSTPRDVLMQQLPYRRSNNEHWLQSLHNTKNQIKALFSTASSLVGREIVQSEGMQSRQQKLNTENCNKSCPEVFLIETSLLIEFLVSTDNILKCSTIYIGSKSFSEPHVSFTSSKERAWKKKQNQIRELRKLLLHIEHYFNESNGGKKSLSKLKFLRHRRRRSFCSIWVQHLRSN